MKKATDDEWKSNHKNKSVNIFSETYFRINHFGNVYQTTRSVWYQVRFILFEKKWDFR